MKLSMMTYTMARREGFTPESCVQLAAELKMDGIDWITTYGRDPLELKKMSHDAGLPVVAHTFFASRMLAGEENWLDEIKQSISDAVALEAPIVMIPTASSDSIARDEFRKIWIDALAQIAPLTSEAGIILTVENFPGKDSPFVIADDFLQAVNKVPSLKLTYDNGNAAGGEDPVESFTRCAKYVVHAHFKDWDISDAPQDGYRQMLDGRYYKPALIGEGNIDHRACLKAMAAAGYDGCINIEYEGNKYLPAEGIRKAVEYLRGLCIE